MARYIGSKHKMQRRIGEDLNLFTNSLKSAKRLNVKPGQHAVKGHHKLSSFGQQLKEKQKIKYIYGILEKQLRKIYQKASRNPTATGSAMLSLLERRLDNVVFRLGWAPTRASARQIVNHGHLLVNDKKMSIPSYTVKVGDILQLKSSIAKVPVIAERLQVDNLVVASWLERKQTAARVLRLPERADIAEAVNEQMVVEYYSR